MPENIPNLDRLLHSMIGVIDTQLQLLKLEARENTAALISGLAVNMLLFVLFSFMLFMFSTALAMLLGRWLGHWAWGFTIMGSGYLIAFSLVLSRIKQLRARISEKVYQQLQPKEQEEPKGIESSAE